MGFLDDLHSIENATKTKESSIALLQLLAKKHEKTLLDRHLNSVFEGLKREIKNAVALQKSEEVDGKRVLQGKYRFSVVVPMNFCFEPPYPDGVDEKMIEDALEYKDEASIKPRIRLETSFLLEKKRLSIWGTKARHEGKASFTDEAKEFFGALEALMKEEGITLGSISAPIISINRMVTFPSYLERVSCSYVVYNDEDIRLNSDDANFITIRYKLIF